LDPAAFDVSLAASSGIAELDVGKFDLAKCFFDEQATGFAGCSTQAASLPLEAFRLAIWEAKADDLGHDYIVTDVNERRAKQKGRPIARAADFLNRAQS
jgi:hypothetical protein